MIQRYLRIIQMSQEVNGFINKSICRIQLGLDYFFFTTSIPMTGEMFVMIKAGEREGQKSWRPEDSTSGHYRYFKHRCCYST